MILVLRCRCALVSTAALHSADDDESGKRGRRTATLHDDPLQCDVYEEDIVGILPVIVLEVKVSE